MNNSEGLDVYDNLRLFLLKQANKFDYKYTKNARQSLTNTLNLVSNISIMDLKSDETNHNHYKRTCGHRFLRGETCWRCLTCAYDETCALCRFCFNPHDHIGHEVHKSTIQRDFAGCCDCGDERAYPNAKCRVYRSKNPNISMQVTEINDELINHLLKFIGILLDFVIDYTNHSISSLSPSKRIDEIKLRHQMSALMTKVYHDIDYETEKYALVLYSDNVHQYRDAVQRIRFTTCKNIEFSEMVATRCNDHGRAVVSVSDNLPFLIREMDVLTSTGLTACIKNVREVFREEMCDDILKWIYQFTQSNIFKNNNELHDIISRTLLSPYRCGCSNQWIDVYFDKVLLTQSRLREKTGCKNEPNCSNTQLNSFNIHKNEMENNDINQDWEISDDIKNECMYFKDPIESESYTGSRFQFLLMFDVRFSTKARMILHNIYIPNVAKNHRFCGMMSAQFMDIYEKIFTSFLLVDREPELSIMPLLSTQLFSSPSNDSIILKHGDVNKLIRTMTEFVTNGMTSGVKSFKFDTESSDQIQKEVLMSGLKNRKWAHVLLDLTYIITRNAEIENIFKFFDCFQNYVYFLSIFQSRPVFSREATNHVEYESQEYTIFFHVVSVIAHFSESIGKVLNRIPKVRLLSQGNSMDCYYHSYSTTMKKPFTETLYTIIIRSIIQIAFSKKTTSTNEYASNRVNREKENAIEFYVCPRFPHFNVVKFDVMKDTVCFLHPLHVMFSWMVEMDQSLDSEKSLSHLLDIIQGEYEFLCIEEMNSNSEISEVKAANYEGVLAFFDFPLRKIVLLSQIKAGLWVRNGSSIKSQMNLYRNAGCREFGYSRDLFLCQYFSSYFKYPELVMYTILERWNLIGWAYGDLKVFPYTAHHLQQILEEFILFMISLVSEDLHLHKLGEVQVSDLLIEREIVHSLCYDKKSYNDIVSCIPDHICSQKRFPIVFKKTVDLVTNRDEDDLTVEKTYALNKDLIATIDPYYVHFTSNRRDNCIQKMKEYIAKKNNMNVLDVIIEPKEIDWSNSPFGKVADIVLDVSLLKFIQTTLGYCKSHLLRDGAIAESNLAKESCESLLGLILHLIHIVVKNKNISSVASVELYKIFDVMFQIYLSDHMVVELTSKTKALLLIIYELLQSSNFDLADRIASSQIDLLKNELKSSPSSSSNSSYSSEKKKKLAKKKRDKLMAKLRKQQLKFAENNKSTETSSSGSELSLDMKPSILAQVSEIVSVTTVDENEANNVISGGPENSFVSVDDTSVPNFDGRSNHTEFSNIGEEEKLESDEQHSKDTYKENARNRTWKFPEHNCLFCHMPSTEENTIFGVFSYISETNVFRYIPDNDDYWIAKAFTNGSNPDDDKMDSGRNELEDFITSVEECEVIGPGFPSFGDDSGSPGYVDNMAIFTSCGHGMHDHCFRGFYASSLNKQFKQITKTIPENTDRREFICPLCKSVNNIFIPILYEKNDKRFSSNFSNGIKATDIVDHKFDEKTIKNPNIVDNVKHELLEKVTASMKDKAWCVSDFVDNKKVYSFPQNSKMVQTLKEFLMSITLLSPPFESFALIISKTIESLEIGLRSETPSRNKREELLVSRLNNRSITGLRIWLQISEFFKSTLSISTGEESQRENLDLYPQSLLGLYSNLINDYNLIFQDQDYFAALIHCEELLILGYSFQKLLGIFFAKHIKQSIMKILVLLWKIDSKLDGDLRGLNRMKCLIVDTYPGNKENFKMAISKFMSHDTVSDDLLNLVYSMLIKVATPFLRKSLILAYAKYAVFESQTEIDENELNECDKICKVMKIPCLVEILDAIDVTFFNNISEKNMKSIQKSRIPYPNTIRLIHLPTELNDIYVKYYLKLDEEDRPDDPAVCLFCGKVVNCQKNEFGNEFGSCTMHSQWECINEGRGIYFLPRNNCCLLLDNGKGTFIDSPYRDEYGELDLDCKKGHELKLVKERYEEFNKNIWLSHNIQNVIAQKLESLSDIGGWDTL